jgi:hypothetical protein
MRDDRDEPNLLAPYTVPYNSIVAAYIAGAASKATGEALKAEAQAFADACPCPYIPYREVAEQAAADAKKALIEGQEYGSPASQLYAARKEAR